MAARTVTSPARLNQAVAQPQPRPPRIDAQWYSPPAVGNAEATCPIVAATTRANRQPSGQPRPIEAPPTLHRPRWNEVMPPARMQRIDIETAKLEKPLRRRSNSWA